MAEKPTVEGVGRVLVRQHTLLRSKIECVRCCTGEERESNLEDLRRFLAAHLAAESVSFPWPADRDADRTGGLIAQDVITSMTALEAVRQDSVDFERGLVDLADVVHRHEEVTTDRLTSGCTATELVSIVDALRSVADVAMGHGDTATVTTDAPFAERFQRAARVFDRLPVDR